MSLWDKIKSIFNGKLIDDFEEILIKESEKTKEKVEFNYEQLKALEDLSNKYHCNKCNDCICDSKCNDCHCDTNSTLVNDSDVLKYEKEDLYYVSLDDIKDEVLCFINENKAFTSVDITNSLRKAGYLCFNKDVSVALREFIKDPNIFNNWTRELINVKNNSLQTYLYFPIGYDINLYQEINQETINTIKNKVNDVIEEENKDVDELREAEELNSEELNSEELNSEELNSEELIEEIRELNKDFYDAVEEHKCSDLYDILIQSIDENGLVCSKKLNAFTKKEIVLIPYYIIKHLNWESFKYIGIQHMGSGLYISSEYNRLYPYCKLAQITKEGILCDDHLLSINGIKENFEIIVDNNFILVVPSDESLITIKGFNK